MDQRNSATGTQAFARAFDKALGKASRLQSRGFHLSRNDRRVILFSQFLAELGPVVSSEAVIREVSDQGAHLEVALDDPRFLASVVFGKAARSSLPAVVQRSLFDDL